MWWERERMSLAAIPLLGRYHQITNYRFLGSIITKVHLQYGKKVIEVKNRLGLFKAQIVGVMLLRRLPRPIPIILPACQRCHCIVIMQSPPPPPFNAPEGIQDSVIFVGSNKGGASQNDGFNAEMS